MALTASVKEELSRLDIKKSSVRKAEVSAMLRFAGGLHIISGRIVIEAEVDLASTAHDQLDEAFFEAEIVPVLARDCAACHVAGGSAEDTRHVLLQGDGEDAIAHNYEVWQAMVAEDGGADLLLDKPTGTVSHSGGERFGRLERWPLKLPVDGTSVHYEAPTVTLPSAPSSAPTGPLRLPISVRDDGTIDHVRIYVDGRKTAWYAGNDRRLDLDPVITLRAGTRRILVVAEDDQGLVTWQRVYVRGEEPSLVDAAP